MYNIKSTGAAQIDGGLVGVTNTACLVDVQNRLRSFKKLFGKRFCPSMVGVHGYTILEY